MQGNQNSGEEELVFLLQWKCESIDDRSKNFQKFCDAIESLGFVHELKEYIVYRSSDVRPQVQKFAVYSMEGSLQKISLSGIF